MESEETSQNVCTFPYSVCAKSHGNPSNISIRTKVVQAVVQKVTCLRCPAWDISDLPSDGKVKMIRQSYSLYEWDVINRLTQITICSSCLPFISRLTGLGSPLGLLSNGSHGNAPLRLQLSRDLRNNALSTFSPSFTDSKTPGFSFPGMLITETLPLPILWPQKLSPDQSEQGFRCLEMFVVIIYPGNNPSFSTNRD